MSSRPLLLLRSLLFALLFYPLTALLVLLALLCLPLGDAPLHRIVHGWGRLHRVLCRVILGQKVRIVGHLPQGPILYIFKHESMFETVDLLCLLRDPMIVAKQELLDIPGWGLLARRFGLIGLRRARGAEAMRHLQEATRAATDSGRPICLFPEGTRVPHGQCPPIRSGFAAMYQILGRPVIPVAVNSGRVSPRHSFLKKPGTITYLVGDTIPPGRPRKEAEARVHAAINALNPPPAAPREEQPA